MTQLTNEQIGKNVAFLRENDGLSMDDVAAAMRLQGHKWTRVTVFNIEHGKRQLKLQEAFDLIGVFHLNLEDGIKRLMAKNPAQAQVQEYVHGIGDILANALPQAILSLRLYRNDLQLALLMSRGGNGSAWLDDAAYADELRAACEEMQVDDLLHATADENMLELIRDLFSVPIPDMMKSSSDDGSPDMDDIGIYQKTSDSLRELVVVNEISGKEYHADTATADTDGESTGKDSED